MFGDRLRKFRTLAGMSQNKLAEMAKVPRPTISLVESGKQRSVTIEVGQRLARALGITFATLVGPERQEDSENVPTELATAGRES